MTEDQNTTVKGFLSELENRATALEEQNKKLPSFYMACIGGMWAQILEYKGDVFNSKVSNELRDWYLAGIAASREAVQQNDKLRELWVKKEKAEDEARKKKKGFRLW